MTEGNTIRSVKFKALGFDHTGFESSVWTIRLQSGGPEIRCCNHNLSRTAIDIGSVYEGALFLECATAAPSLWPRRVFQVLRNSMMDGSGMLACGRYVRNVTVAVSYKYFEIDVGWPLYTDLELSDCRMPVNIGEFVEVDGVLMMELKEDEDYIV